VDPRLSQIVFGWSEYAKENMFLQKLWWKFVAGDIINVRWPNGEVEVGPSSRAWDGVMNPYCRQIVESSDPNDHYRPWLEKHVGKQGRDWQWRIEGLDRLTIGFRRGKTKWATLAALQWN